MKRALFVVLVLLAASRADAITYYVNDTGGDDTRSCATAQASGTPKKTISGGVACLVSNNGDVVEIAAGTYTGTLNKVDSQTFTVNGSSSWATANTIRAAAGATVTIRPPSGQEAIRLTSSTQSYLIFQDLILDGVNNPDDGAPNCALFQWQGSHHIRLDDVEVENWPNYGVCFDGAGATNGETFNEVLDSEIHDNGSGTDQTNGHAFYVTSGENLFDGNLIYNNLGYGFHLYDNSGPKIINRNIIRNNKIYANGRNSSTTSYGIVIAWGTNNQIYNNLIYDNLYGGVQDYTGAETTKYYNNTITGNVRGFDLQFYSSGATLTNNIVYNNSSADITDFGGTGTPTQTTNLTSNPTFVNAGADDYHLQAGSAARNTGTTVATVATDYDGVARPQGAFYDIGAYEYDEGSPPPTGGGLPTVPRLRLRLR